MSLILCLISFVLSISFTHYPYKFTKFCVISKQINIPHITLTMTFSMLNLCRRSRSVKQSRHLIYLRFLHNRLRIILKRKTFKSRFKLCFIIIKSSCCVWKFRKHISILERLDFHTSGQLESWRIKNTIRILLYTLGASGS